MTPTEDQVLALAPDAQVASSGRKLAAPSHWRNLGRSEAALWGECQGSALYQVRVDLADLSSKCSCPSRKFPCKHGVGLLLLHAADPQRVAPVAEPPWVTEWLAKRGEKQAAKQERTAQAKDGDVADPAAQARRAQQRASRVEAGLEQLVTWAGDLARRGMASLEGGGAAELARQAERMVDAQAPALASRLRRMAELPGSHPDWPQRALGELGRLVLLCHAYRSLDRLPVPLQRDVLQAVGQAESLDEVARGGERLADAWCVVAQVVDDADRVRVQRTWLVGETSRRAALLLQFAPGNAPFPAQVPPASRVDAELAFFPSAFPLRAMLVERRSDLRPLASLPGHARIEDFLDAHASALARQPWLDRLACVLEGVVPACGEGGGGWRVIDRDGSSLPLLTGRTTRPWSLLALSGGRPLDLAGEWDGHALRPLLLACDGEAHVVSESAA